MRFMTKLLMLLLCLALPLAAWAEEHVAFTDDLTATYAWPEGDAPVYIYRCAYPQLAGESETAALFNSTYRMLVEDALGFECPMNATSLPLDGPQMLVDVSYEVTHQSAERLSVKVIKRVTYGESVSVILTGRTFPLAGEKAGLAASLPHLLGLLDAGETDEWYLNRQIEKADKCVRGLVWDMLADMELPLYDDLTYEEYEANFYPEEDFYLNEAGDFVFFLQEGSVMPREHGAVECVIPLEDLLDEI